MDPYESVIQIDNNSFPEDDQEVSCIDYLLNKKHQYTMPHMDPAIDRDLNKHKELLQPLYNFVTAMDKWFDLCNSHDKSRKKG